MFLREKKVYLSIFLLLGIIIGIIIPILLWNISFYQGYILYFIILLIYTHKKYNLINILNPVSYYLIYYFGFILFGGLFAAKYSNRILISENAFILVLLGIQFFLLGSFVWGILSKRNASMYKKNIYTTWDYKKANYISILLLLVGSMLAIFYYYLAGGIPILHENADYFRVKIKEGKSWLYLLSYGFYLVGLLIYSLNNMVIGKNKIPLLFSIIGSIIFIGLGYRSPAFQLLLMSYVLYSYFKYKKIRLLRVFLFGMVLLFLVGLTGSLRSKGLDIVNNLNIIWLTLEWRFFVQFNNIQLILDWINNNQFLYGKSLLIDLKTLLPGYQPSFAIWLKDSMGMDFAGGFTPTIIGESYANFGLIGVTMASFLIGLLTQAIYTYLLRNKNITLYQIGILLLLSFSIGSIVSSGIFTALKNVLLPFLGLYIVTNKLFLKYGK